MWNKWIKPRTTWLFLFSVCYQTLCCHWILLSVSLSLNQKHVMLWRLNIREDRANSLAWPPGGRWFGFTSRGLIRSSDDCDKRREEKKSSNLKETLSHTDNETVLHQHEKQAGWIQSSRQRPREDAADHCDRLWDTEDGQMKSNSELQMWLWAGFQSVFTLVWLCRKH